MKFNNAAEAIQYYITTSAVGISPGAGRDSIESVLREKVNSSPSYKMIWADMIHAKVDIESIFFECFPQKWIQRVMMHWAVDGYDEAIDGTLVTVSRFHANISIRSRERMLGAWIRRLTKALSTHDYLKGAKVDFNQRTLKSA